MRIILAIAALACASRAGAAESTSFAFPAAGKGEIAVEVTKFDPERCVLTMAPKGGTLVLKAETKSRTGIFRRGCEAGFKVTAPAALPVKVDTGAGSILFDGLSGRIQASTGAGLRVSAMSGVGSVAIVKS